MSTLHLTEQNPQFITQFLSEEINEEELAHWQAHYGECQSCQEYIETSEQSNILVQQAEEKQVPSHLSPYLNAEMTFLTASEIWSQLQSQIKTETTPTNVLLKLFVEKQKVYEEPLQNRAAGVSQTFSNVELPEVFLSEEEVQLVFEEDPLDHSLNIGLQGSSAKARLNTTLKVVYHTGQFELFEGKTIALGSMWSLNSQKAQNIHHFELIYQEH